MIDIVIPAIAGLLAGALASLVAPWATWGVEKKRLVREARTNLISEARSLLGSDLAEVKFSHHPVYSRLRPHLSDNLIKSIERPAKNGIQTITIVQGHGRHSGVNPYVQRTLDELTELERKWELI